jgi:hypothetical protein
VEFVKVNPVEIDMEEINSSVLLETPIKAHSGTGNLAGAILFISLAQSIRDLDGVRYSTAQRYATTRLK